MRIHAATLFLVAVLLTGCDKSAVSPTVETAPRLYFEPNAVKIGRTQDADLTLKIDSFAAPIFAVSLRIAYNDAVVSFSDSLGLQRGDYFGQEALMFVGSSDSTLHLSLCRIQSQTSSGTSGAFCILTFTGKAAGSGEIRILPDELCFYNSDGEAIDITELQTKTAVIQVE